MNDKTGRAIAVSISELAQAITRLATATERAYTPAYLGGGGGYPSGTWTSGGGVGGKPGGVQPQGGGGGAHGGGSLVLVAEHGTEMVG